MEWYRILGLCIVGIFIIMMFRVGIKMTLKSIKEDKNIRERLDDESYIIPETGERVEFNEYLIKSKNPEWNGGLHDDTIALIDDPILKEIELTKKHLFDSSNYESIYLDDAYEKTFSFSRLISDNEEYQILELFESDNTYYAIADLTNHQITDKTFFVIKKLGFKSGQYCFVPKLKHDRLLDKFIDQEITSKQYKVHVFETSPQIEKVNQLVEKLENVSNVKWELIGDSIIIVGMNILNRKDLKTVETVMKAI